MTDLIANHPLLTREREKQRWIEVVTPARWLLVLTAAALLAASVLGTVTAWSVLHRTPGDSSAEAGFARDMSIHHQQAVQMAMLVLERTDDPGIRVMAGNIALTQQNQLGQMLGWLDLWNLPPTGRAPAMAWMGHASDGALPGMATSVEINQLGTLTGVNADRAFLRLMIRHHQGGLPMAQAILERSDEPVVRQLATSIVTSQTAEVQTMEAMLVAKGG